MFSLSEPSQLAFKLRKKRPWVFLHWKLWNYFCHYFFHLGLLWLSRVLHQKNVQKNLNRKVFNKTEHVSTSTSHETIIQIIIRIIVSFTDPPFEVNFPFLYPLKTLNVFRVYRHGALARNTLIASFYQLFPHY